jgi:hypothetical protein
MPPFQEQKQSGGSPIFSLKNPDFDGGKFGSARNFEVKKDW